MVALHAFLALGAGFATMALLAAAMTALLVWRVPSWASETGQRTPAYAFVNVGFSFLAAAAGGYVTAWVASANPLQHVLVLGIIVLAVSALSALQAKDRQPIWALLLAVGLTPFGALAGGLLRLRMIGIL